MRSLLVAASASVLLMTAPVWAQNTVKSGNLSSQDKQFVEKAAAGNLAEAELGQLAEQKAVTPAVKEYGRWLATDHSFANKRLMTITKELGAWQQPQLTQEKKQLRQKLEGLSGAQFDQQYVQAMVQDHKKDIPDFQKQAREGQNQLLKSYAGNLVPVLQQHLAEAEELQASNGGMAAGQGSPAAGMSGSSTPPTAPTR